MAVRSETAPSMALGSATASPTPMLTTILRKRGTCIGFLYPKRLVSAGTTAAGIVLSSCSSLLCLHRSVGGFVAAPADALFALALDDARELAGLVALGAYVHQPAHRHRQLLLEDARLD